jgi:sulfoxide reductase heme-binding subunit YedZ
MTLAQLTQDQVRWIKAAVFVLCLVPLALLVWRGLNRGLGANPIEYITHSIGWWTLTFLLITLSVTPLRRLSGWNWLLRLRRMLGLFAFFHVCLHFTTYIWLDQFFDWMSIVKDIAAALHGGIRGVRPVDSGRRPPPMRW